MVVCKFWSRGDCRNGDSCRFEHPGSRRDGGGSRNPFDALSDNRQNSAGRGNNSNQSRPFGGNNNSSNNNNSSSNSQDDYGLRYDEIALDLREPPVWLLSCYGPGRNAPIQLFGGEPREISFEEARLNYYSLATQGREPEARNAEDALVRDARLQIENAQRDINGAISYVKNGANQHPNRLDVARGASATNSGGGGGGGGNAFGGGGGAPASSAFGQPSGLGGAGGGGGAGAFGQPSGSAFGRPSQPAFGQASQPQNPFGQPAGAAPPSSQPAFGQPAFGQPSQPQNPFGQPSGPTPSPFGQPSQQAGPAFGQPSQPANPFGQPAQPAQPAPSPFGQPTQQQQQQQQQQQPPQQANPFGQPSNPFGGPSAPNGAQNPFMGLGGGQQQQAQQAQQAQQNQQQGQPGGFGRAAPGPAAPGGGAASQPAAVKGMNGQLQSFNGRPVRYQPDETGKSAPYVAMPNGGLQKVYFPDGKAWIKPDDAPLERYTPELEAAYQRAKQMGGFGDGPMPDLPPKREWTTWNV